MPANNYAPAFRIAQESEECKACGHGLTVTIVYTDDSGEECGIGISWDDDGEGHEAAKNLLDEMNFAYDLGFKRAYSAGEAS